MLTYLFLAIIVSVVTVFLTNFVGSLILKEPIQKRVYFATISYAFILWLFYFFLPASFYGPTPFFIEGLVGLIIAVIVGPDWQNDSINNASPAILFAILIIIIAAVIELVNSPIFTASSRAELIGEVEIKDGLPENFDPIDISHVCLVSEKMARTKANEALSKMILENGGNAGTRFKIGKGTKVFADNQYWWVFVVDFDGFWKWRSDGYVPGYLRVPAQNPYGSAEPVQFNKQGKPIKIRYLNSAYRENWAERYIKTHGYENRILRDWTFEPDDNWNPYYTISVLKRNFGFNGYTVEGVLIFDVQTGDIQFKKLDELPSWVDRGVPLDVLDEQLTAWGKWSGGGYYFYDPNPTSQVPTEGWYLTYSSDNKPVWFTGFTSVGSANDLTGFSLSDSRTGKTVFYIMDGVTEDLALSIAKSHWSNYTNYELQTLTPYNIFGEWTYIIPVAYRDTTKNGDLAYQFRGVSLVSVKNKDINASGWTPDEAFANYRRVLMSKRFSYSPNGGKLNKMELTGVIKEVGLPREQGNQQIFSFLLEGQPKIFEVPYSFENPTVLFMKPGRKVRITFLDTKEKVITCESFELLSIKLSDENPRQARFVESQKDYKKETDRVQKIRKRSKLLRSDAFKEIDPDSLERLMEEYMKKHKK